MATLRHFFEWVHQLFVSFDHRLTRIEDHQIQTNRITNEKLDEILRLLNNDEPKEKQLNPSVDADYQQAKA